MKLRTYAALLRETARLSVKAPFTIEREYARIRQDIDLKGIKALGVQHAAAARLDPTNSVKYCDVSYWLRVNILRALRLRLGEKAGLKILDLGCGAGYFVSVCRNLGHEAIGADIPAEELGAPDSAIYPALSSALHCRKMIQPLKISRFTPLAITGDYELITAFMICFNNHKRKDVWGVDEWEFFLNDAIGHLRPGGRMVLQLNEDPVSYPDLRYYSARQLEMFRSRGTVDNHEIIVTRP